MTIREKRQKRAGLIEMARKILNTAEGENRDLSDEERQAYDAKIGEIDALGGDIEREERQQALETSLQRPTQREMRPAVDGAAIGMNAEEIRQYSLVRAIRAAASGDWSGAGLERKAHEATASQLKREAHGFFVPYDVIGARSEKRDLQAGVGSSGGYLVSTDLLGESFIELLRNRMVLQRAGVTTLSGLVGDLAIPKQTGGATAYWLGEGGAPTESQQTIGQVALTPKTVGAYTDYTRKLLMQSSIDIEAFVRADLAAVLALAIDLAGFHGLGAANQPKGLQYVSGIGSVAGGTNGLAPTWAHMVGLETEVATDNADAGRLAYISNAKVRGKLKGTPRTATYGDIMIWEPNAGNTPVNGYPFYVSNQVSSALTKGSSSGVCSAIFFGNWADMIIGMWGALDILVDPYTHSTSGSVRVVAHQDVDIAVRHAESFAAMLDALTT